MSIIPPLELCKQIPEGAFVDSQLVWTESNGDNCYVAFRRPGCKGTPAPTLAEILKEMADAKMRFHNVTCEADEDFCVVAFVEYRGKPGSELKERRDRNPATAALELWLEGRK